MLTILIKKKKTGLIPPLPLTTWIASCSQLGALVHGLPLTPIPAPELNVPSTGHSVDAEDQNQWCLPLSWDTEHPAIDVPTRPPCSIVHQPVTLPETLILLPASSALCPPPSQPQSRVPLPAVTSYIYPCWQTDLPRAAPSEQYLSPPN